jgi:hypothetical protein
VDAAEMIGQPGGPIASNSGCTTGLVDGATTRDSTAGRAYRASRPPSPQQFIWRDFVMAELVTRNDLEVARRELQSSIYSTRHDLDVVRRELEAKIDNQTLRLTVRMGVMTSLLAALTRLHL